MACCSRAEVYGLLFPGRGEQVSVFTEPDWSRELARVGVTLRLLHTEYVDATTGAGGVAMAYDRFCKTYAHYLLVTGASSRVGHMAGRTVEVDWSGPTMRLTDSIAGTTRKVYLFVG